MPNRVTPKGWITQRNGHALFNEKERWMIEYLSLSYGVTEKEVIRMALEHEYQKCVSKPFEDESKKERINENESTDSSGSDRERRYLDVYKKLFWST